MASRDFGGEQMVQAYATALMNAGRSPLQSGNSVPVQTMQMATKPTLRQRLGLFILGADGGQVVFGPQQPLQPTAQYPEAQVIGRPWDYPVGFNTRVTPRGETVSFQTLKNLSVGYDVLRGLIERVKDKIVSKQWSIQPRAKDAKRDKRCDEVQAFFEFPDRENSWQDWARMLMDQAITIDATSIYLRPDRGGRLYSCEIIDGAMIQPKIMADGRTPPPDVGPAYQQVIKTGLPAVDYIKPVPVGQSVPLDSQGWPMPELLYKPRNKRVDSPYGFGPIEQMITTINIALSREASLLSFYTNGSAPDTVFTCPPQWTTQDIANFKMWWDSVLEGNIQNRRGTMFVPDGAKPLNLKDGILTDQTDEWLIRVLCFFMGLNPMPFLKQMNKGQEKTHHDEAQQEGLEPWQEWLADLIGTIIRVKFGYPDLKLHWEEDEAIDPMEAAQIDQILVNAKIYHPDEIRSRRGDDAMPDELRAQMDVATFNAAANSTVLPEDQQAVKDAAAQAIAAAKPAPVMAPQPTAKDKEVQRAHEIELAKLAAPIVNVTTPPVNISPAAVNVAPASVNVNAPITLPDIKAADVFVDVGGTTIQNKFESPRNVTKKVVSAERMQDGTFRGVIKDSTATEVVSTQTQDGQTVVKIKE